MKKHIVIPLLVILGCLIIFFITQWQYPGGPTGTTGTAEEGSVEGAGLADSGDSTTLSADERTNARNGRLDSKESAGDRDLQPVAVTTEIIAATEASQPADETIEYPTKEGFWITGFSKTEDGKFIPGAVITAEKKGEEKTKYGTRTITSATFEALTDTHGHYEVQTDGPGKYELRSRAPKYIGEFIDGFGKCELSETEKIATVDLIHRTGSGYWIVGTVKSESGEPIPGSKISAYYIVFDRGPIYRTQSDSKGNYVLKVGGPGVHAVYSEPTGEYIPEREVARLCTAEQPEKQTMVNFVHRAGGCLVHGRVIDGETSEPIPDAIVRLSSHNPLGLAGYFEVFTDENGKFQIRISEDLYAVSAEAKGYLHYRGIEDSGGGLDSLEINKETAQNEIVIKMRRGLAVKIIATDPSGKPVERATVLVYSSHSDGNGRTDSNGECVIDTLSEGSAVAIVEKNWGKEERSSGGLYKETRGQSAGDEVVSKAYSEPFVPGPRENPPVVRVTLLECASVSGHVTYKESGKPVANRQMSIEFLNFAAVFGRPLTSEGSTDGDGIYGFSRLAPGKYVISVNRNSSYEQLASQDITLQAAEHREGLDFAIEDEEANEVVEGKIVNEQGEAIPFAYVGLSTKDPKKPDASIWKHANANDQGEFKFTELPKADSFRISVRASGYSEVNQEQFPMNGELLTITLKPSASIAGVVLSKEKRIPVPNAKVSIQVFYGGTVTADSMGQFEIKDVEPGAYEVTAEAEGYATGKSAPIAIKGEESVRDVVIELEFGKEFAGILIDPMQNPLGGGTVGLASRVRNTNRELSSNSFQLIAIPDNVKSADDGSFRVGGVPSQGDTLLISHPQFAPRKFAVSSEMLGREPIPIQLTPGGAIEGNVVDQQQKPVQGARIDVFNYPENLYCYN
ncbi:MAG TPA: carboxypeptidase-like regulatory domain-containing protein, partial [bacterium]|nr:carboxypeptidase-like regulatory domain-containing protein [bacterium]